MDYVDVELEFQFVDKTTKKLTYGPFTINDPMLNTLKENIKTLNATYAQWWENFGNEDGSPLIVAGGVYPNVPILNATIIARSESELNL